MSKRAICMACHKPYDYQRKSKKACSAKCRARLNRIADNLSAELLNSLTVIKLAIVLEHTGLLESEERAIFDIAEILFPLIRSFEEVKTE